MSDFVDAAACGDLDGVRELLADASLSAEVINAIDKDGRSAFHYACLNDDARLLTLLLAEPRVVASLRSPKGDTGVHMSALYAALEALGLLLADPRTAALVDAQNDFGETPLHLCAGSGDKGAAKAANLLLAAGAPLWAVDRWNRGPRDVSRDNAENPLVATFEAHLAGNPAERVKVDAVTAAYKAESEAAASHTADAVAANKTAKNAIFGQLGAVKLKKTKTKVKGMFRKKKKKKKKKDGEAGAGGAAAVRDVRDVGDGRRALSKLIDFPGDAAEIRAHLANPAEVDPAGRDAYGLTALHKVRSFVRLCVCVSSLSLPRFVISHTSTSSDGYFSFPPLARCHSLHRGTRQSCLSCCCRTSQMISSTRSAQMGRRRCIGRWRWRRADRLKSSSQQG